jgi:hypothetical protein
VLEVRRTRRAFCVGVRPEVRCDIGFTAGSGWQLLIALGSLRRHTVWLNFVWLFALLLPTGYWLQRPWMAIAAVIVICAVAPVVGGLVASPLSEWIAAACGAALGSFLRRRRTTGI